MKRTTSTAKTRGMITRIITTTTATVKAYNTETDEITEFSVEIPGTVNDRKVITAIYNSGCIDKAKYKILAVRDIQTTGILYGMNLDTFIEHADVIEENITTD